MKRARNFLIGLSALLALGSPLFAEDAWKPPEDGALEEKHVENYAKFLEELAKAGGTWHSRTRAMRTKPENKAIDESGVSPDEVAWARTQIEAILVPLVAQDAKPEDLDKLEAKTKERLQQELAKIEAIAKHGPPELKHVDAAQTEVRESERAMSQASVDMILAKIALGSAERAAKDKSPEDPASKDLALAQERYKHIEKAYVAATDRASKAWLAWADLSDKVVKAGAREGIERAEKASQARKDLEDIEAMRKVKADEHALDRFPKKSVDAVRAKKDRLVKAFRAIGAPLPG